MAFLREVVKFLLAGGITAIVIMALAVLGMLFPVCGCDADRARIAALDNGSTVIDGWETYADLPVYVDCSCSEIPCEVLANAGLWWHQQIQRRTGLDIDVVRVRAWTVSEEYGCFVFDDLPPGVHSIESGNWVAGRLTGTWLARIQRDYWWPAIVRHAIGHALRLADDPPTSVTLDLRSIMQADAPAWGTVTEKDAWLVVGNDSN